VKGREGDPRDGLLRCVHQVLDVHLGNGAQVLDRVVAALGVVAGLDVVEDRRSQFLAGGPPPAVEQVELQGRRGPE